MGQDERISVRASADLVERLERVRAAIEEANPGLTVSAGAALRRALEVGLGVLEREHKVKVPKSRK